MSESISVSKSFIVEKILEDNPSVYVHLKGSAPGVVVPSHLKNKEYVVLQVGFNMPVPIPDLEINDMGVSGTLSFRGVPFWCDIPWDSVVALIGDNGKGQVYDKDYVSTLAAPTEPPRKLKTGKVIPPYLRVVK